MKNDSVVLSKMVYSFARNNPIVLVNQKKKDGE